VENISDTAGNYGNIKHKPCLKIKIKCLFSTWTVTGIAVNELKLCWSLVSVNRHGETEGFDPAHENVM